MENKHRLEIVGITYNQIESGVYALVLKEVDGTRRIPIVIGFPEAQAIECRLQNINTPRPLTHDMASAVMAGYGITLREVLIHMLPNGVFAADMFFTDGTNEIIIDARSSDAVAMAIRNDAPIYCTDDVMNNAAFDNDARSTGQQPASAPKPAAPAVTAKKTAELKYLDDAELRKAMEKAVAEENYEEAARIKEELDKRTK